MKHEFHGGSGTAQMALALHIVYGSNTTYELRHDCGLNSINMEVLILNMSFVVAE